MGSNWNIKKDFFYLKSSVFCHSNVSAQIKLHQNVFNDNVQNRTMKSYKGRLNVKIRWTWLPVLGSFLSNDGRYLAFTDALHRI